MIKKRKQKTKRIRKIISKKKTSSPSLKLKRGKKIIKKSVLVSKKLSAQKSPENILREVRLIRVMPQLSDEASLRLVNAQSFIAEELFPLTMAELKQEISNVLSEQVSLEKVFDDARVPLRVSEKIKASEKKKANILKELTLYRITLTLLWPVVKVSGALYWMGKVAYIRKRKNQEEEKKHKLSEGETAVDVFAPLPKKSLSENFINFSRHALVYSLGVFIALAIPSLGVFWYGKISHQKNSILSASRKAVEYLQTAGNSAVFLRLDEAQKNFEKSKKYFDEAKKNFYKINAVTRAIALRLPKVGDNIQSGLTLLEAGKNIAEAGEDISKALHQLMFDSKDKVGNTESLFLAGLAGLGESIDIAIPKIAQAKIKIEALDASDLSLPDSSVLKNVKSFLPALERDLSDMSSALKALLQLLGYSGWQRYLLVFENNNEMRATGGFMGSFALVDVGEGRIKNLEVPAGGSYDLQGSLVSTSASPEALHLINPIWQFQDSNWWPDFPVSAEKISWFYLKSQGPSVDGVIAITSTFLEDLLQITGQIEMEKYGRIITSDNFVRETQKIVEKEYDKTENRPKQFLSDLAPILYEKILNFSTADLQKFFDILIKSLKEKQVVFYSANPEIQKLILDLDWGGEQKKAEYGDYVSVINSNIAGGKTDGAIVEVIEHTSELLQDGRIYNTLRVTRTHKGDPQDEFEGAQNVNYVRIYVPLGSTLVFASGFLRPDDSLFEDPPFGFSTDEDLKEREGEHLVEPETRTEIYSEEDKTVFANWIMVKPGETKTYEVKYLLPATIAKFQNVYSLTFQKQIGSRNTFVSSRFIYPENYQIKESYPETETLWFKKGVSEVSYNTLLLRDIFYAVLLEGI